MVATYQYVLSGYMKQTTAKCVNWTKADKNAGCYEKIYGGDHTTMEKMAKTKNSFVCPSP